ncbi:MAG: aspartate/glutamate racemase family protein [Gemmatimonadota bacterium]|nr:MAG: aspartate/glutamate racemase family protein [Gemmatimonadota bacterium]
MRVIGLLGGMSWESTAEYYRIINQEVRRRLGRQYSAKILMYSVEFEEIEQLQTAGEWDRAGQLLAGEARRLERGGADFLLLCTNTMHKVARAIEDAIDIPLIHIADATAERVRQADVGRVGLLGTRFTMEEEFYRGRLAEQHGLEVLIPPPEDRAVVDRIIFAELCQGQILEPSRREYVRIIEALGAQGGEGVILGCTEIGLLIKPEHSPLPVFDTTQIHAEKGVQLALAED